MDVSPSPSMAQFLMNSGTGGTTGHENSPSNKWPKCTKTYNSRWETDPLLKTWIARHPGDNGKVVCRFCQSVIRAHKNDLLEHTRTLKHQRNFMAHTTPEEYNQFVMELNELRKDAQVVTTKKKTGSSSGSTNGNKSHLHHHHQSSRDLNNSTSNSSWTLCKSPNVSSLDSSGGGVNQIELWPADNNDSYMSAADSPSDLVSVVLEEQPFLEQRASPQGSLNSNESNSSISALTSSSISQQPVTVAMAITATTIPSLLHHHHSNNNISSSSSNNNNNNNGNSTGGTSRRDIKQHETSPFTCQDVISAIEDNFFSLSELVALAKSALGQIECSVNNRASSADVKLFNSNNSSPSHKFPKNGGKQLLKAKDVLVRRKR